MRPSPELATFGGWWWWWWFFNSPPPGRIHVIGESWIFFVGKFGGFNVEWNGGKGDEEGKRGKSFFFWLGVEVLDHDHTDSLLVFGMALWIGENFSLVFNVASSRLGEELEEVKYNEAQQFR